MTDLRALSEPRTEAGKRLERKVMADPNARVIDVVTHEDILDIERTLAPGAGLDAAWSAAEAALPEGWVMDGVRAEYDRREVVSWVARATEPGNPDLDVESLHYGRVPLAVGRGDTATAALNDLAASLADVSGTTATEGES